METLQPKIQDGDSTELTLKQDRVPGSLGLPLAVQKKQIIFLNLSFPDCRKGEYRTYFKGLFRMK